MSTKNLIQLTVYLSLTLASASAQAFDLLKMHCFRQDVSGDRLFQSEIHFRKAGNATKSHQHQMTDAPAYEGELLSYSVTGNTRKYISGYNLYSISYHDEMISGLTGDPVTRKDGTFTLTKIGMRPSGPWKFAFTSTNGTNVDADFKCIYADANLN